MRRFLRCCAFLAGMAACSAAHSQEESASCLQKGRVLKSESLRVATLNLAHGRGLALNQMLQRSAATRENLVRVARLLRDIDADLVALQEADGPSRWSGNFDHVEFLARAAVYPCTTHGLHAVTWLYSFGTALLARTRFATQMTHDFAPSPPTASKGFTLGAFDWNPGGALDAPVRLHVVSVHLDFSRESVREAQLAEMSRRLDTLTPPIIVLGDFNAEWRKGGSALQDIAERAGLVTWQPEAGHLGTYKDGKKRLDWILASNDLEFRSMRVADERVSDHLAVIAELSLKR